MLVLVLDSSATASVALGRVEAGSVEILAQRFTQDTRSHAEVMAPFVDQVMAEAAVIPADVDALVTGTGPGPFTGLRAGIVTARTLGFAWGKPVYGLMSLYSLAEQVAQAARADGQGEIGQGEIGQGEILLATDARRREIYSAVFSLSEDSYSLVSGPIVGFAAEAPKLPAYGRGAGIYAQDLAAVAGYEDLQPRADSLLAAAARIGIENLSTDTSALYLRESDAKVPVARKKAGA